MPHGASCDVIPVPGMTGCPCLLSLAEFGVNTTSGIIATIEGQQHYSHGYGENGCAPHDVLRPPSCRVNLPSDGTENVKLDLPRWCFLPWCYVNATDCNVAVTAYEYDIGANLYYSYDA